MASPLEHLQPYRDLAFESLSKLFSALSEKEISKYDFTLSNIYRDLTELPESPANHPYVGLFGIKPLDNQRDSLIATLDEKLFKVKELIDVDYQIDALIREMSNLDKRPKSRGAYEGLYVITEKPKVTVAEVSPGAKVNTKKLSLSQEGLDLIKHFEGLHLTAYPDPGSFDGKPYTIGFGSTYIFGRPVQLGEKISLAQATDQLRKDVIKFENAVRNAVKVELTLHEFDALVSFCYNTGIGNFNSSTLLKELNRGNYEEAFVTQLQRWNKGGDKDGDGKKDELAGLTRRRKAEAKLAGYHIA